MAASVPFGVNRWLLPREPAARHHQTRPGPHSRRPSGLRQNLTERVREERVFGAVRCPAGRCPARAAHGTLRAAAGGSGEVHGPASRVRRYACAVRPLHQPFLRYFKPCVDRASLRLEVSRQPAGGLAVGAIDLFFKRRGRGLGTGLPALLPPGSLQQVPPSPSAVEVSLGAPAAGQRPGPSHSSDTAGPHKRGGGTDTALSPPPPPSHKVWVH